MALIALAVLVLSVASVPGSTAAVIAGSGLAVGCLVAAVRLDRRAERRVLLDGAFSLASPAGASSTAMMLLVLGVGAGSFIPYVLSVAHHTSPIVAGYVAALSSLAWSIAALLSAGASVAASRRLLALAPVAVAVALFGVGWSLWAGSLAGHRGLLDLVRGRRGQRVAPPRLPAHRLFADRRTRLRRRFRHHPADPRRDFRRGLCRHDRQPGRSRKFDRARGRGQGGLLLFLGFTLPPLLAVFASARLLRLTAAETSAELQPAIAKTARTAD